MIGYVLVDKEPGISSAGVITKLRKKFNLKRIGHSGTLDPMASGLLLCFVGQATRLSNYLVLADKTYTGKFKFGITSNSEDITGMITSETTPTFSEKDLLLAKEKLSGIIQQIPPQVSAIHVNGKRAYDLARQGESFELAPRTVEIKNFDVKLLPEYECYFKIECSKGTYIRSIARDLGQMLNCGAVLTELRREAVGKLSITYAKKIDQITCNDILPWSDLFPEALPLSLELRQVNMLLSGNDKVLAELPNAGSYEYAVVSCLDKPRILLKNVSGKFNFAVNFTED